MIVTFLFFFLSLVKATNRCSTDDPNGSTTTVSDGTNTRCFSEIIPQTATLPMPVLFWFHGQGGNGGHCGDFGDSDFSMKLGDYAHKYGFALICGEGLQDVYGRGGSWAVPEIQTNVTGTKCDASEAVEGFNSNVDIIYMQNVLKNLIGRSDTFDMKRIYTAGCSMGSAFSEFISTCLHQWANENDPRKEYTQIGISGFATHSTGLKIKGDGFNFPPANNKSVSWGECDGCQYFPVVPSRQPGLKACLNDNTGDPSTRNPFFYKSTVQMAEKWKGLGNRAETFYNSGGHCQIHSFWDVVNCLDDGTGNLIGNGTKPGLM